MNTVAVVGSSLAGLSAVRALRAQGFAGQIVVVGDELGAPYDRPPLSKGFLAGTLPLADLDLLGADESLDVEWRTGVAATGLDAAGRCITLADGGRIDVDGLVVATGARPRQPWPEVPAGVHVLRTLADATALRAELRPGVRLVVVGAGFIGAEVASTARGLGVDVTVLEAAPAPLSAALGAQLGGVIAGLHEAHGVRLESGVAVTGFVGTDRVTGVQLADGRRVPADVVLLGLGVLPNVEWLAGSGLDLTHGVRCDAWGGTTLPNVVAVGDCATWFDPALGTHHRIEHWSSAKERAAVAVSTLLSAGTLHRAARPPYFWSDQYGVRLQVAGYTGGADEVVIEAGSLDDPVNEGVLAVYRRAGEPVAVLAVGHSGSFMRWRKQLAAASRAMSEAAS